MLQLLLALAAAAGPAQTTATKWKVERSVSKMDDSTIVVATLPAEDQLKRWPATTYRPALLFRCKEKRLEAYFDIGGPAASATADGAAPIMIRVDKNPPERWLGDRSTSNDALFISPGWLVPRLVDGRALLLRVTPFNSVPQDVSFDLTGLEPAFDQVTAACGGASIGELRQRALDARKAEEARAVAAAQAEAKALADTRAAVEKNLQSERPFDRARAARDAAKFGGDFVPQLVALLRDPSWDARIAAAQALGQIGGPARAALNQLEAAAGDPSLGIQQAAREAAQKIRAASP